MGKNFAARQKGAVLLENAYQWAVSDIASVVRNNFRTAVLGVPKYTLLAGARLAVDYGGTRQGTIGDCHFVAAVDGMAYVRPLAVVGTPPIVLGGKGTGLVWERGNLGNSDFGVNWFGRLTSMPVDAPTLPELAYYASADDGLWMTVLDKGYLKLRGQSFFYSLFDKAMPASFANGDMIQNSIKAISPSGRATTSLTAFSNAKDMYTTINNAINANKIVTAGTSRLLPDIFNQTAVPPNGHAYTVLGIIPGPDGSFPWENAEVELRNPWGGGTGPYDGAFNYSIDDFLSKFFAVAVEG